MHSGEKVGILLINTGTTDAPRAPETRTYLKEFLSDPRILDINPVVRWLLLNLVILPRRPKQSAHAYSAVWTEQGSPLIVITRELVAALKEKMPECEFAIGMRYGNPSVKSGLESLVEKNVDRIIVAPMYPQYSSAANGSALELVYKLAGKYWNVPHISAVPPFHADKGFLDAWATLCKPMVEQFQPDLVLMSYHGLPERQIKKSDITGQYCLKHDCCCEEVVDANRNCYRAHCFQTSRALAERLGLPQEQWSVSFQSRLGRDPWIKPATDLVIPTLPKKGIKRLAVICPAFTADCLETLEEIAIRARSDFLMAGGEAFQHIPCLNAHPAWVDALAALLRRY
ncbi:MAG: ferrochelatase [Candidatus Hydrogenedentes bacterium]|nr:ferrochelatase [Candidatus Hydrogenedentota bacterium]